MSMSKSSPKSILSHRFDTKWLYAECYAYRRLTQCVRSVSASMWDEDVFETQKRESFASTADAAKSVVLK